MTRTIKLFLGMLCIQLSAQELSFEKAEKLASEGNCKEALETLHQLMQQSPPKVSQYGLKAACLLRLNKFDAAMETFANAVKLMPDSALIYDIRGTVYAQMEMIPEAIADYTIGLKKTKDSVLSSHLLSNRATARYHVRDFKNALIDLKKALKLDSTNVNIYTNLALVYIELNKKEEALDFLHKVVRMDSNNVLGYLNLGYNYQKFNEHKKAVVQFNKALELDPKQAYAYSNRGFSKLKLGDKEGAMNDINKSLEMNPYNSYAYKNRALVRLEEEKQALACEDLIKAVKLGYTNQYGSEVQELINKYCK